MRRHSEATLMGLTKKELVEYVRMAEYNQDVAEETLKQQAENVKDWMPVMHGRWVLGKVEPGYFTPGGNRPWICSECGYLASWMLDKPKDNYCPNCGAKMDLEGR